MTTQSDERLAELAQVCHRMRYLIVDEIGKLGVGHLGGSLSEVEALVVLYYGGYLRVDPRNPQLEGRDRFILSKGHSGPALYAVLADRGFFPVSELQTLNTSGTNLPSHPDMNLTPGVDMTTGSLGQGFSAAVGVATAARLRADGARVFTLIGDGESHEGQIWEAALYAGHSRLDNLVAFTDFNGMTIDGTVEQINGLEPLADKWTAFGWNTVTVDGHDLAAVDRAVREAVAHTGQPSMIVLRTTKGKGVSFIEEAGTSNHNMPISAEQTAAALQELGAP
ncbi:MAG: transketolase [Beutenbergiaceae bacterium]